MTTIQYINLAPEVESRLAWLETHGFTVRPLWAEHRKRLEAADTDTPSEDDLRYTCPTDAPRIEEHIHRGNKVVLSATGAFEGYGYSLSPGQRQWLRDHYDFTPTSTVTLTRLVLWPGTQSPRAMVLKSDVHLEPGKRTAVLTEVTLTQPGKFLHEAGLIDAALADAKPRDGVVTTYNPDCSTIAVKVGPEVITSVALGRLRPPTIGSPCTIAWRVVYNRLDRTYSEGWYLLSAESSQVRSQKRTTLERKRNTIPGSLDELLGELMKG